ncbi:hypothetical protein [Prochlorococcus sp. MIT 1223]|uniref:hypothetical protein n=1 Tax=Prochlorococcus sp. MIT 1223 TaxID=3096217 RepID=UPI002A7542D8|nr:hypothetical protein [Prochlorococcus sp. MIT 1223]
MTSKACIDFGTIEARRLRIHKRKMAMLTFIRDGLERRIASVNASIEKLQEQIKRDESLPTE